MADKQIIDEVDVSKCKYHNNGWCLLSESCDAIRYRLCGDMTLFDCYYRNWQRKEQELQEAMDNYVQLDLQRVKEYNELVELYKAKEQECEKLKETLTEIKEIARQEIDSKEFMIVQCMLNGNVDDKNKVLKQILQKISECDVENA